MHHDRPLGLPPNAALHKGTDPVRAKGGAVVGGRWEIAELDGCAQAELVHKKQVTPVELVEAASQRIKDLNGVLNAIVARIDDTGSQLEALEHTTPEPPFAGVPTLLKDLGAEYPGSTLSAGSQYVDGYVCRETSPIVARMQRAGLIFLGRSNSSEFGVASETTLFGRTNNPWDLERSPGGSSAGAAAAVAARIVPVAHGSDGGGSIRSPASRCGVFGLKPSRGRVPRSPDGHDTTDGLGVEHVLTWSVRDSAALLDCLAGPEPGVAVVPPSREASYAACVQQDPPQLRIAVSVAGAGVVAVDEACAEAAIETGRLCEALGHVVEYDAPEYDVLAMLTAFAGAQSDSNAAAAMRWSRLLGKPLALDELGPVTRFMVERGLARTAIDHIQSVSALRLVSTKIAPFFDSYDVFLTPATPTPPFVHADSAVDGRPLTEYWDHELGKGLFAIMANVTGRPAMSLPLHLPSQRLPVGSHFTGQLGGEKALFQLAGQLERAQPWGDQWPKGILAYADRTISAT